MCLQETNEGRVRIGERRRRGKSVNIIRVRASITLGSFLKTYGGVWLGWAYGILKEQEAVRQKMDEEMHGLARERGKSIFYFNVLYCSQLERRLNCLIQSVSFNS